jgi:hypothetical protein
MQGLRDLGWAVGTGITAVLLNVVEILRLQPFVVVW